MHVLVQHIVTHNHFIQVSEVVVEEVDGEEGVVVVVEEEDGVVDEVVVVEDEEVESSYLIFHT